MLYTLLLLGCLIVEHAHFLHEFFFFELQLLFSLLRTHSNLILLHKDLCNALVTFSGGRNSCYLLLINFTPLDHLAKTTAHVFELKVSTRLWTSVLVVGVVLKVDALVVHQIGFLV